MHTTSDNILSDTDFHAHGHFKVLRANTPNKMDCTMGICHFHFCLRPNVTWERCAACKVIRQHEGANSAKKKTGFCRHKSPDPLNQIV